MGPLDSVRIVEVGGIGPGPFAAMVLSDLGADVIRIDRPGSADGPAGGEGLLTAANLLHRGRPSVAIDLKRPEGRALVLRLCANADALIEGFRPGVMERLGLGPDDVAAVNTRLVYGRVTGYGQQGPLARAAGHDLTYIALAGALGAIGRPGELPQPPLNLVGDFGGGGMLLALGIVCALWEARGSGRGQVVDAAMVDGAALLTTLFFGLHQTGQWGERGTNVIDSGAPFYEVYECADGHHIAVAAVEPRFYAALLAGLDIDPLDAPQWDRQAWPAHKARFAAVLATRTRSAWVKRFAGTDACVAPVLGLDDVAAHPQAVARDAFAVVDGVSQPAPAPRFSRTPGAIARGPAARLGTEPGALEAWGLGSPEVASLVRDGVVGAATPPV